MKLLAVFLCAALASSGTAAPADTAVPKAPANPSEADQERGRVVFDKGYALFQDRKYDEAIAEFRVAYGLSGDPTLLYNIALVGERAGKYDLALEYLQAYRVLAPPEEHAKLDEKAEAFRKAKVAASNADGTSGGAEAGDGASPDDVPPDKPDDANRRVFTPAAAALTVIAGVSFVTALGLGLAARKRNRDAEDQCGSGEAGQLCADEARDDLRRSRKLALGTDIMIGIGSASVLALVVVLATNASRKGRAKKAAALALPGGAGLAWRF